MIRKTSLIALLFALSLSVSADSLVACLEKIPSVQTIHISPKMFRLMGVAYKDSLLTKNSIDHLCSMDIIMADEPFAIVELTRKTAAYIQQNAYAEVERQREGDEHTMIFHKNVSPCAVFVLCTESPSEYVVSVIQGNLSKEEVKNFLRSLPVEGSKPLH